MLRLGHWPGIYSVLSLPLTAQLPSCPPGPQSPPQVRLVGPPFHTEQITGAGGPCLPDILGAVSCSCHPCLCLAPQLAPKTRPVSVSGLPTGVGCGELCKAKTPRGRGIDLLGISKWECGRPVPGCPPWVLAQPQPVLSERKPWVPGHLARPAPPLQSGERDQDGAWGLHWGTPAFTAPAGLWRRVSELSLCQAPMPTLALPRLLVSPDRMPHGHGPAQRGQHLVPVRGAHATG